MRPYDPVAHALSINRRSFLTKSAYGLGSAAFAMLAAKSGFADLHAASFSKGVLKAPHLPVKAKRVIFLCMAGGPPHLELFDNKPVLKKLDGQPFPESFTKGQQIAQLQGAVLKARGGSFEFKKWGKSGTEITDIFPHIGSVADDLCVVRSLKTEQINHDTAHAFFNTGSIIKGRPSMGSWLLYGLGSETENLPGYIVLTSAGRTGLQPISSRQWSSGVLPSKYQGIQFQSKGEAVHYIGNPEGVCQSTQRQVIDEIRRLNGQLAQETVDPEIATRVAQYEMAFKMQSSVPELLDFKSESAKTIEAYGIKEVELAGTGSLAPAPFAAELKSRGLVPVAGHFGYALFEKDIAAVIRDATTLGLKFVIIPYPPVSKDKPFSEEMAHSMAAKFNEWGAACKKAGLMFGYHPHGLEFRPTAAGNGETMFDLLVKADTRDTTRRANEYYTLAGQLSSTAGWQTRIGSFKLPGCYARS